jgi:hypothetical protein
MTLALLLGVFLACAAIGVSFLRAARKVRAVRACAGFAMLVFVAPMSFWIGAFVEQFDSGQCYSASIHMIAKAVERTEDPAGLSERIRSLPMHGYETVCRDVEAAAATLPGADRDE